MLTASLARNEILLEQYCWQVCFSPMRRVSLRRPGYSVLRPLRPERRHLLVPRVVSDFTVRG